MVGGKGVVGGWGEGVWWVGRERGCGGWVGWEERVWWAGGEGRVWWVVKL